MSSFLADTLFVESKILQMASKDILQYATILVSPLFVWALISDYVSGKSILDTVKRMVLTLLLLGFYYQFHEGAVKTSFELAESFIKMPKYAQNAVISETALKELSSERVGKGASKLKNASYYKKFKETLSLVQEGITYNLIGTVLVAIIKLCLIFVKYVYSGVYHFSYCFLGVIALVHLFHFGKDSLGNALKSTLWCVLMPWVVAIILIYFGEVIAHVFTEDSVPLSEIILITVFSAFLLFSPFFTKKLLDGTGVVTLAENFGKMATQTVMLGGAMAIGKAGTTVAASKMASFKDRIHWGANQVRDRQQLSAATIVANNGKSPVSPAKTSKEKTLLGLDWMMNPSRNMNLEKSKILAAKALTKDGLGAQKVSHMNLVQSQGKSRSPVESAQKMYFKVKEDSQSEMKRVMAKKLQKNRESRNASNRENSFNKSNSQNVIQEVSHKGQVKTNNQVSNTHNSKVQSGGSSVYQGKTEVQKNSVASTKSVNQSVVKSASKTNGGRPDTARYQYRLYRPNQQTQQFVRRSALNERDS